MDRGRQTSPNITKHWQLMEGSLLVVENSQAWLQAKLTALQLMASCSGPGDCRSTPNCSEDRHPRDGKQCKNLNDTERARGEKKLKPPTRINAVHCTVLCWSLLRFAHKNLSKVQASQESQGQFPLTGLAKVPSWARGAQGDLWKKSSVKHG